MRAALLSSPPAVRWPRFAAPAARVTAVDDQRSAADRFPAGVAPATLVPLARVSAVAARRPGLTLPLEDLFTSHLAAEGYAVDPATRRALWDQHAHDVPWHVVADWPLEAIARLPFGHTVMNRFDHLFRGGSGWRSGAPAMNPTLRLVGKLENSLWRYGFGRADWNTVVDAYTLLRTFTWAVPGFTVTLDWTTGCNEFGYAECQRGQRGLFLDAPLAVTVHAPDADGPRPVATIGFALAAPRRLLVTQVQLRAARGNRWLYRLGRPLVAHALDRLAAAAGDRFALYLVEGTTLADRVRHQHDCAQAARDRDHAPALPPLDDAVAARIADTYDRPIAGWTRCPDDVVAAHRLRWHRVQPTASAVTAAEVA